MLLLLAVAASKAAASCGFASRRAGGVQRLRQESQRAAAGCLELLGPQSVGPQEISAVAAAPAPGTLRLLVAAESLRGAADRERRRLLTRACCGGAFARVRLRAPPALRCARCLSVRVCARRRPARARGEGGRERERERKGKREREE